MLQPPARKFCCAVCGEDALFLPGQSWLTGRTFCLVSKRQWALRKWFPEPCPRPKAGRPGHGLHPTPSPSGIQGSGPRGRKGLSHPRLHLSVSTEGRVRKGTPSSLYQGRHWYRERRDSPQGLQPARGHTQDRKAVLPSSRAHALHFHRVAAFVFVIHLTVPEEILPRFPQPSPTRQWLGPDSAFAVLFLPSPPALSPLVPPSLRSAAQMGTFAMRP